MSESAGRQRSGALRWLCWLPLVALLVVELEVQRYDGWGAWAAAPLLLVPALIGLPLAIVGAADTIAAARARAPIGESARATALAALPILWLGIRRYFT